MKTVIHVKYTQSVSSRPYVKTSRLGKSHVVKFMKSSLPEVGIPYRVCQFFFCPYIVCKITRRCMDKKKFSTFSYKLVQISPIMILVNSGAFLSISSWICELTELIFVMIPYISSTGYPLKTQRIMGMCK